ncbi:hypothetical protein Bbelb_215460 [Branchiostoma belcheri]|nr:hypothetical protein Bbelb_215460 [Branchiostoma belcheri]
MPTHAGAVIGVVIVLLLVGLAFVAYRYFRLRKRAAEPTVSYDRGTTSIGADNPVFDSIPGAMAAPVMAPGVQVHKGDHLMYMQNPLYDQVNGMVAPEKEQLPPGAEAPPPYEENPGELQLTEEELRIKQKAAEAGYPETTVYKNSFVPYTTRLWNSLPRDVREAATYNQFRLKCKAQMLTTRRHQKFRKLGDRRSNILSTRLRLDWSQLNSTLVKFNLTPRSCSCGAKSESVAYYLLHCPLHKDARQTLATAVRSVVDQSLSTNMLLNGLPGHNLPTNQKISAALQGYILQTKRF